MTPTPYYSDDHVTLYHGDARELLWDVVADVCVTDPPYGIGVEYGRFSDTTANVAQLVADVVPVLRSKCQRVALTPGVSNLWLYPQPDWTLGWFIPAGAGRGPWGFSCWQPVIVYGRDPFLAKGLGCRPDAVEYVAPGDPDGALEHPCPKPVDLMRWVIGRVSVDPSEVLLDPFAGSGTTLRAAKDLGRRAVGIELEERYCETAAKRMGQEVLQLDAPPVEDELASWLGVGA